MDGLNYISMSLTLIMDKIQDWFLCLREGQEITKIWYYDSQEPGIYTFSSNRVISKVMGKLEESRQQQFIKCPAPRLKLDLAQLMCNPRNSALTCGEAFDTAKPHFPVTENKMVKWKLDENQDGWT